MHVKNKKTKNTLKMKIYIKRVIVLENKKQKK